MGETISYLQKDGRPKSIVRISSLLSNSCSRYHLPTRTGDAAALASRRRNIIRMVVEVVLLNSTSIGAISP